MERKKSPQWKPPERFRDWPAVSCERSSMEQLRSYERHVRETRCGTCRWWWPGNGGSCSEGPRAMAAAESDTCPKWTAKAAKGAKR